MEAFGSCLLLFLFIFLEKQRYSEEWFLSDDSSRTAELGRVPNLSKRRFLAVPSTGSLKEREINVTAFGDDNGLRVLFRSVEHAKLSFPPVLFCRNVRHAVGIARKRRLLA